MKKYYMPTTLIVFLFITAIMMCSCRKNSGTSGEILYGTWIKGTNTGDTLRFFNKNGKNIMTRNLSFNPALWAPVESEYIYKNGKLSVRLYGASNDFSSVTSFRWIQAGHEFEIQGIELFSFMASTMVYFTFHKIQ